MSSGDRFWIRSPKFDSAWIIGPHFYSVLLALLIYPLVKDWEPMPLWIWFGLVLCVDVAHVYSTLFRVYLNKNERSRYQLIGWLIPLGVWVVGVLLYSLSSVVFWRCLAYLAVFHFIRQQYGFFRIYSRKDQGRSVLFKALNQYAIYFVTVIPILIWHFTGPKHFNWFIDSDFIYWNSENSAYVVYFLSGLLLLSIAGYAIAETQNSMKTQIINWPKNGIYLGTLLVWYIGIVHFNNDIIFTLTNVIAHGVPYLALVWSYKTRQNHNYEFRFLKINSVWIFFPCLVALAYFEEFLWASLVWKEHLPVFFLTRDQTTEVSGVLLSYLVPLLAVPQGTHYILDAFIWKIRDSKQNQWMAELS